MKRWLACLGDQCGITFPLVIAVMLVCLLIPCRIMEFFRLSLIASRVKEALQDAVVVVVNDNYANVYHGVWEGYSGGYYTERYGSEEWVDTGDIYYYLDGALETRWEGGSRVKYTGGALEYKTTGLDVTIRSVPLAPPDLASVQQSEVDVVVWLEVPAQSAGKTFPTMKMKPKV